MTHQGRAALLGAAVAALAAYAVTYERVLLRWGATPEEVDGPLPGDEIVGADPVYRSTRAVDIEAPPDRVWPWLVQMGQGRGGLYSYDRLENLLGLDIHSADRIVPGLQDLAVGDPVRLTPPGTTPELVFRVHTLEPPSVLVLGPSGTAAEAFEQGLPHPAWTFAVRPRGEHGSRLVVRFQLVVPPTRVNRVVYRHGMGPVHFVMERRMLLGIKERAETSG